MEKLAGGTGVAQEEAVPGVRRSRVAICGPSGYALGLLVSHLRRWEGGNRKARGIGVRLRIVRTRGAAVLHPYKETWEKTLTLKIAGCGTQFAADARCCLSVAC